MQGQLLTETARVLEDPVDRPVEVGEDDPGVRVPEPEAAHGRAEQRVVVPGHVVDAAEAAGAVVVGRGGALPEGEDGRQAPRRRVPRHHDVRRAVADEPLHRTCISIAKLDRSLPGIGKLRRLK